MLDRTDLQLMLVERVIQMGTDELMEVWTHLTGDQLELYDEGQDIIIGEVESLALNDPSFLKTFLGFLIYALGERVSIEDEDTNDNMRTIP